MNKKLFKRYVLPALLILSCSSTYAAITLSVDTTVGPSDVSLENQDVIVDGVILTIDGAHTLGDLQVINGGSVTHTAGLSGGLNITADSVDVGFGSTINAEAKGGLGSGSAISGGTYGGVGGSSTAASFGSFEYPLSLGEGAGCYSGSSVRGGGAIMIQTQALTVNGDIVASGDTSQALSCAGAAGGSIQINGGVVTGTGSIKSIGADAKEQPGAGIYKPGGGGGGRISITYSDFQLGENQVIVTGGNGANGGHVGEPGTKFTKQDNGLQKRLVTSSVQSPDAVQVLADLLSGSLQGSDFDLVTNSGFVSANGDSFTISGLMWEVSEALDIVDLNLVNGAIISSLPDDIALNITAQTIAISPGSKISAEAKGGGVSVHTSSGLLGGTHAGIGGHSAAVPFGSYENPISVGEGVRCYGSSHLRGGGAIQIQTQTLDVNGDIDASGDSNALQCPGAAGGSIQINAGVITGNGFIKAVGANADATSSGFAYKPGGGGGGRISITYDDLQLVEENIVVTGGEGRNGGPLGTAGTVYTKQNSDPQKQLITSSVGSHDAAQVLSDLLSGSLQGADFKLSTSQGYILASGDSFSVSGLIWELSQELDIADLSLINNAVVTHVAGGLPLDITAQTITIDSGAKISAEAKGDLGTISTHGGSHGGSHGGIGGKSTVVPFGSYQSPSTFGGGGMCTSGSSERGGGAVKIQTQALVVNGEVNANGATNLFRCAGPAGGSLQINAGTISGNGFIYASGTDADATTAGFTFKPGGGGGGRVSLRYDNLLLDEDHIQANGGVGKHTAAAGEMGSIFFEQNGNSLKRLVSVSLSSSDSETLLQSLISGANVGDNYRIEVGVGFLETLAGAFTVSNLTWIIDGEIEIGSLSLLDNAKLTHSPEHLTGMQVSAQSIFVDATSAIDVSGLGFIGVGLSSNVGGSYGGVGGNNLSGGAYGSIEMPVDLGTGGGCISSPTTRGGGAVKLTTQSVEVVGSILADGEGDFYQCAGTSGGSIWIDTGVLRGSGLISAQGKNADKTGAAYSYVPGGGGGRIAISYGLLDSFDINTQVLVQGGTAPQGGPAGESGTIHLVDGQSPTQVVSSTPTENKTVATALSNITVQFRNKIEVTSFTVADITLTGSIVGVVPISGILKISDFEYQIQASQTLADDTYQLILGPDVTVPSGYQMDQDLDGVDGETPDDQFILNFSVDTQPPQAVSVTNYLPAPAVNQVNSTSIVIEGTRADIAAVEIAGDVRVALGTGDFTIPDVLLAQGVNQIDLFAVDQGGNQSPASSLIFNVDSVPPVVTSITPSAYLKVAPTLILISVDEAGSGLDNGSTNLVLTKNGINVPGSIVVVPGEVRFSPSIVLVQGDYALTGTVQDLAGNISTVIHSFVLDYTPPLAPVVNAVPATVNNSALVVGGEKESDAAILINGVEVVSHNGGVIWTSNVTLAQGDNTLSIQALDLAGNVSAASVVSVRFDDSPPGPVTLSSPELNGNGESIVLRWPSYSEVANGGDIASYQIYREASSFSDVAALSSIASVTPGNNAVTISDHPRNTSLYYAVVAVDAQGLRDTSVIASAYQPVDTQAPEEIGNLDVTVNSDSLYLSWIPSANSSNDLAGYKVYVTDGATTNETALLVADVGAANPVTHTVSGLLPATAYPIRVVAFDENENASVGLTNSGVTLLPHPSNVALAAFSGRIDLSWLNPTNTGLVQAYKIYAETTSFTNVGGLTAKRIVGPSETSSALAGLVDGTTYYIAITTLNISGGESQSVTTTAATPQADNDGPIVETISWVQNNVTVALTSATLTADGYVTLTANDQAGMGRAELEIDGVLLASDLSNVDGYRLPLDLFGLADGTHTLTIRVFDSLENSTESDQAVSIALGQPPAPVITSPSEDQTLNEIAQNIQGTSAKNTAINVYVNDVAVAIDIALSSAESFLQTINLQEGVNVIEVAAYYPGRDVLSARSSGLNLTLDTSIPNPPNNVTTTAKNLGQVFVRWQAAVNTDTVNLIAGYNVYRSASHFTSASESGVGKLNTEIIDSLVYIDMPALDGEYYYAVSTENSLGTESAISPSVAVNSDSQAPTAAITYTAEGNVEPISGRTSVGLVSLSVEFTEALRNEPYLAIVPEGGLPSTISLTKSNQGTETHPIYVGQYSIQTTTPSGTAYVVMSAHDEAGNRGTDVTSGASINIDTHGPEIAVLQLNPTDPIENVIDGQNQGRTIEVYVTLNDDVGLSTIPTLVPLINGEAVTPFDIVSEQGIILVEDSQQSALNAPLYLGSFQLPVSAGQTDVGEDTAETLSFAFHAVDDLGNETTKILGQNQFQVYQGSLPPLAVPFGLTAKAIQGGKVLLSWKTVEAAAGYRIYRKAPGEESFTLLEALNDGLLVQHTDGEDQTMMDGLYHYTIASVRERNGQQGESVQSDVVSVSTDATLPLPPTALSAELTSIGIRVNWQKPLVDADGNPESGLVSYKLYRLPLEQGQEAAIDLTATAAILVDIDTLNSIDQQPSESEHMYTVTAVDESGNESEAATGVYLNFGLLPVSNLQVELLEAGFPSLSWQHSGVAITGFDIYALSSDANSQDVKLNTTLVTNQNFTDDSYNNGNVGVGAAATRSYRVVALDDNGVESLDHDINLPALSVNLTDDQILHRGVMNRLSFRIENTSNFAVENLTLEVVVDDGGTLKLHRSAAVNVPAAGFTDAFVVVGGYPSLLASTTLQLTLIQSPNLSDSVRIHQSTSIEVSDAAVLATIVTEDFTRGGTGIARLKVENTSEVEIEIVTAESNGQSASTELRLQLLDSDDNVLSIASVKQAVGIDVVTLPSGYSVARIAPGQVWQSAPVTITVPSASPDDVTLKLQIDAFHYQLGKDSQVSMPGTGASKNLTLSDTDYYGQLDMISPISVFGDETITITGTARDSDTDVVLPYVPLTAILTVDGFEKVYPLYPNQNGEFKFQFNPAGQTGLYTVAILHPAIQDRPVHGQFIASGAGVSPTEHKLQLPRNYSQAIDVKVTAGAATTLSNVSLEFVSDETGGALAAGLSVDVSEPIDLLEKQSGFVQVTLTGDNSAPVSGKLHFNVVADGVAEPIGNFTLTYTLVEVGPALFPTPTLVETGLARSSTVLETVVFKNTGLDVLQDGQLSLSDPAGGSVPDWATLLTPASLGDIAIGEELTVQLRFTPDATVAEANYILSLDVVGDNMPVRKLPVLVAVTQSGVGSAFFHASDIYTATLHENGVPIAGLTGANVKLQNELVLSEVFEATTDVNGELNFDDIPAGRYSYRATAFDHETVAGRIDVKPGITVAEDVFLLNQLVSVSFSVREITLEDRYEVNLDATFETDVPVAVVAIEPLRVDLPMMSKGDVFYGELQLTNYGLIRAYDVNPELPADTALAKFELLSDVPENLEAGQVVNLSYRVIALTDFDPGLDGDASGGGCLSTVQSILITTSCSCTNGVVVDAVSVSTIGYTAASCSLNEVTGSVTSSSSLGGTSSIPTLFVRPTSIIGAQNSSCASAGYDVSNDDIEITGRGGGAGRSPSSTSNTNGLTCE